MSRRLNPVTTIIGVVIGVVIAVHGISDALNPGRETIRSAGFSAKAPKGWVDGTKDNRSRLTSGDDRVYGEPDEVRGPRVIVNVATEPGTDAGSVLDGVASRIGESGSLAGVSQVGEPRPATLDGVPARALTLRSTIGGKPYVDHVLVAARGPRIYAVHLVRPASQDAEARKDLREIAGSWDWS